MSDQLVITEVEVAKDLPDWQGKGAKVYRYTIEGDERRPEDFVPNGQEPKKPGDTIPGIENGEYGPKVRKASRQGGGGFKKSPEESRKITRMHSQEMALMEQAAIIASGGRPFSEEQMKEQIGWWEADALAKQKQGVIFWPTASDVPADTSDLFPPKAA